MKTITLLAAAMLAVGGFYLFTLKQGDKTPANLPPWYPAQTENGDPVFAVFESRVPCPEPGCEKMKFALALYKNPQTNAPTAYLMARVLVATGKNDRVVSAGEWSITQGTALDPDATVYQLDANAPEGFRSYWVIGEGILFILDQNKNPRVGTAGYGYALNRVGE